VIGAAQLARRRRELAIPPERERERPSSRQTPIESNVTISRAASSIRSSTCSNGSDPAIARAIAAHDAANP
jgi:hypothetical protein